MQKGLRIRARTMQHFRSARKAAATAHRALRGSRLRPERVRHAGRLLGGLGLVWRFDCQCPSVEGSQEIRGCKASPDCEPQGRTRSLLPLYRNPLHIEQDSGSQNVYPESQDPVEGKDGRGEPKAPHPPCSRDVMSGSRCRLWRGKRSPAPGTACPSILPGGCALHLIYKAPGSRQRHSFFGALVEEGPGAGALLGRH